MKKQMVCDNQNSLERATVELKKVNMSIIKYPLFSVCPRTLLDKIIYQFILFYVIFPFLTNALSLLYKCSLFCINGFYLSDTVHKQHIYIFFLSPSNCLDSCRLGNGTALSIGPELNMLWGLRRFWVLLALNQYQSFIMPPTSKKLGGHIASGLFVRPSFRPSVRHAF